ncbi:uncharacterized protein TNCT_664381 [Trichonephila clavata]|uniref:Uncharacterized protein n=1 Tax=Trichonephila clavata TaxID=2740835 RepID=A0A8X6G3E7_TRICU|nr:uncharacterized protein TNCT_664381 [Trichonephila clavata]
MALSSSTKCLLILLIINCSLKWCLAIPIQNDEYASSTSTEDPSATPTDEPSTTTTMGPSTTMDPEEAVKMLLWFMLESIHEM